MFGELIIAVVYLPILFLEGTEGKLFRPMALTVLFALGGSLILVADSDAGVGVHGAAEETGRKGSLARPPHQMDVPTVRRTCRTHALL